MRSRQSEAERQRERGRDEVPRIDPDRRADLHDGKEQERCGRGGPEQDGVITAQGSGDAMDKQSPEDDAKTDAKRCHPDRLAEHELQESPVDRRVCVDPAAVDVEVTRHRRRDPGRIDGLDRRAEVLVVDPELATNRAEVLPRHHVPGDSHALERDSDRLAALNVPAVGGGEVEDGTPRAEIRSRRIAVGRHVLDQDSLLLRAKGHADVDLAVVPHHDARDSGAKRDEQRQGITARDRHAGDGNRAASGDQCGRSRNPAR